MDKGAEGYKCFLAGDDEGMVDIIRDYKDGLMAYLLGITGSFDLAEDMMQETFVKLAIKKPRFNERSSFKTWLYAIGHNVAVDHLRKRRFLSDTPIEEMDLRDESETLERIVIREEQKIALHRAMKDLKEEYRQVLYLTYFEEMSNAEAALVMKKNKRQIENLVYRAKAALREVLGKEGFSDEEL